MNGSIRRIGVAGYMGAGKTTCAQIIAESFGGEVINADLEAKNLMDSNQDIKNRLIAEFGDDILEDAAISSKKLGDKAFSSHNALHALNSIVHPLLIDHLHRQLMELQNKASLCILDAALIPLWKIDNWFDIRIWVDASFESRFARLLAKQPWLGESTLRKRMDMQEALFEPPNFYSWTRLYNCSDIAEIKDKLGPILTEKSPITNSE